MNKNLQKIITIDGPAGAGKTTMARELARRLTWIYLDTGALYRALALAAERRGVDCADQPAAEDLARSLEITAVPKPEGTAIYVDGEDVTPYLRRPDVSLRASTISAWPGVREALLSIQKTLGDKGEVVAEGRDMGTVVFPGAGLKLFLYASPEARANRRYKELIAKGENVTYDGVLKDIVHRDECDRNRPVSPLKAAPDALTIDSTNLEPDAVLKVMVNAFRNRFFAKYDS
ncbi:(d)CMP kinase [Deltaproteobacteria bacterium OttesenSCG-928-M10]|nr:(d)CMP kinase [Deltaproteobacteria bacterium OttesenSCG-928-M10]